jgi:3-oxoadipate enol-lactonase
VRDRLRALIVASPAEGYASCCGAIERMDLRADLRQIDAPTLVIGGSDDEATPLDHQELIAASIPGARLEVIAPAAHLAPVERPREVAALMLDHLDARTAGRRR